MKESIHIGLACKYAKRRKNARRRDEITKRRHAKRRNSEKPPSEITKKRTQKKRKHEILPGEKIKLRKDARQNDEKKRFKCRYFAWRFFVFSRLFVVFSHGGFRYFVFSPGLIFFSFFCVAFCLFVCLFAWRLSSFAAPLRQAKKTK